MSETRADDRDPGQPTRREFVSLLGLSAAGLFAGPFEIGKLDQGLVPEDKKFTKAWLDSLTARGGATEYRLSRKELDWIGMPIGGIATGQLYLGGDGKLWLWDVFNLPPAPEACNGAGPHYATPQKPASPLAQGFAVRASSSKGVQTALLERTGFAEIAFRGQYPIAFVEYRDDRLPVDVDLAAYSPFVPLELDSSNLPATIFEFRVRNKTAEKITVELSGWLENAVCHATGGTGTLLRSNELVRGHDLSWISCSAKGAEAAPDFGTLALALFEGEGDVFGAPSGDEMQDFEALNGPQDRTRVVREDQPFGEKLVGTLGSRLHLHAHGEATVRFVVAWRFDGLWRDALGFLPDIEHRRRHYGKRFPDAVAVAQHVWKNYASLRGGTFAFHECWYGGTLPWWLLERTLTSASTLATSTCLLFDDGRFYGWEGVGSCAGTCTHVWHYAQAVARLFPEIERGLRERVDFGLSFHDDSGQIDYRGEAARDFAVDGQAGTILRAYREHQMSPDAALLKRIWPRVRKSIERLMQLDPDEDGILSGAQYNTLDAAWYGEIAWISTLYLAALRAGAAMAREAGNAPDFAAKLDAIVAKGSANLVARLYDGEYFVQKPDPAHPEANNTNAGCHIDQVLGESWARQLGLARVVPEKECRSALHSLYRYNLAPDVGVYRDGMKAIQGGRWYALPGEGGLLMCTFPKGGAEQATGKGGDAWAAGYFNECMSGFEHQVAGHMLHEGLVEEGLAVERLIHDRYHASRRNPWNEIECGDHYARAMASYGVFLGACGFEYHGPKKHLAFAPRIRPEEFKAAFTAAEGWGTIEQKREEGKRQTQHIVVCHGKLRLKTLAFELEKEVATVKVEAGRPATSQVSGKLVRVTFRDELVLVPGTNLDVMIAY